MWPTVRGHYGPGTRSSPRLRVAAAVAAVVAVVVVVAHSACGGGLHSARDGDALFHESRGAGHMHVPGAAELAAVEGYLRAELSRTAAAIIAEHKEREGWGGWDLTALARVRAARRGPLTTDDQTVGAGGGDGDDASPTPATIRVAAAVVYCNKPSLVNGANATEVLLRKRAGAYFANALVMVGDAEAAMEITADVAHACDGRARCDFTATHAVPVLYCNAYGKVAIDYSCEVAADVESRAGRAAAAVRSTAVYTADTTTLTLRCDAPAPRWASWAPGGAGYMPTPVRYAADPRGLVSTASHAAFKVWPIEFAVPFSKMRASLSYKTTAFAPLVPGNKGTYDMSFHHARVGTTQPEIAYFAQYGTAYYCVTRKKMGWDTLRHIEILASGCVPYFVDLHRLPASTMPFFPRALVWQAMHLEGVRFRGDANGAYIDPASYSIDFDVFNKTRYFELASRILEHTRRYLSAEAMVKYIFRALDIEADAASTASATGTHKRVLFVHQCFKDYLSDSIILGLKGLEDIGEIESVDDVVAPREAGLGMWTEPVYNDGCAGGRKLNLHARPESLDHDGYYRYETGLGHSNAANLPRDGVDYGAVLAKVRAKAYDVVIFGTIDRTRYLYDEVTTVYPRHQVVFLRGGDFPDVPENGMFAVARDLATKGVLFSRELYDDADGVTEHAQAQWLAPGRHDTDGLHCCDSSIPRFGVRQHTPNPRNPQLQPLEGAAVAYLPLGPHHADVVCYGRARFGYASGGVGASWTEVSRSTYDPFRCATTADGGIFEDPPPGSSDSGADRAPPVCECLHNSEWRPVGAENDVVSCHGHARFGSRAHGAWSRITFERHTTFKCKNNGQDGPFDDPVAGVPKACECMWFVDPGTAGGGGGGGGDGGIGEVHGVRFELVGKENAEVRCAGVLRFGDPATDRWSKVFYKEATPVLCMNTRAGGPFEDPIPGRPKQCECQAIDGPIIKP